MTDTVKIEQAAREAAAEFVFSPDNFSPDPAQRQTLRGDAGMMIQCEPMPAVTEDGWCEWIHPLPGYLMQCCDCGLTHEVQFEIVPADENDLSRLNPGESAEKVIIFRMRRHEEAHHG